MNSFETLFQTRCACSGTVIELSSVPCYMPGKKKNFFSVKLVPSRKELLKKRVSPQSESEDAPIYLHHFIQPYSGRSALLRTCHANSLHSKVEDFIC